MIGRNELSSEFLGIMLGDGSLPKNSNHSHIYLNGIDEKRYVHYVKVQILDKLFGKSIFKLRFSNDWPNSKAVNFENTRKDIFNAICELGKSTDKTGLIPGNKVLNQVDIPDWVFSDRKFQIKCLKGLFDTDGDITVVGSGNLRLGFTSGSVNLIHDFYKLGQDLGLITAKTKIVEDRRKNGTKRINIYNTEDIRNFIKIINPEKLREPARRIWIGSWLILYYSPKFVKTRVNKRIAAFKAEIFPKHFQYTEKNANLLKSWLEQEYNEYSKSEFYPLDLSIQEHIIDYKPKRFNLDIEIIEHAIKTSLSGNPREDYLQLADDNIDTVKIIRFPSELKNEIINRIYIIVREDNKERIANFIEFTFSLIKNKFPRIYNESMFISRYFTLKSYFLSILLIIREAFYLNINDPSKLSAVNVLKSLSEKDIKIRYQRKFVRNVFSSLENQFPDDFEEIIQKKELIKERTGKIPIRYIEFTKIEKKGNYKIIFHEVKNEIKIFNFSKILRCSIARYIYESLKNKELSSDNLIEEIFQIFKPFIYKYKISLYHYFLCMILVIKEIMSRMSRNETLSRLKIKSYFVESNIDIPFSAKSLSEMIWCLKSGFPKDFK